MLHDPFKIKPFLTLLNNKTHIKVIQRGNVKSLKRPDIAQLKGTSLLFNKCLKSRQTPNSFSSLTSAYSSVRICLGQSTAA